MFFAQFSCTTISFTWIIIGFTCLLISTTNVVFPILKWWRCFFYIFLHQVYYPILLFYLGCLVLEYFLFFIKVSKVFFLFSLQGIHCLAGNSLVAVAPSLDILERPGLSFITSVYFFCDVLLLLSDKLADEIDLDLFIVFYCVFCFSFLRSPLFIQRLWFI